MLLLTIDKLAEWELQANLSRLKVDTTINIPVTSEDNGWDKATLDINRASSKVHNVNYCVMTIC